MRTAIHHGRSGGSKGHPAAVTRAESQRDRALRVPGGLVRQLRAGFGDLFRRTSDRPARRGERDHRRHAELHDADFAAGFGKDDWRWSCSCRTCSTNSRRSHASRSARSRSAAARSTSCRSVRARSGSSSRRSSSRYRARTALSEGGSATIRPFFCPRLPLERQRSELEREPRSPRPGLLDEHVGVGTELAGRRRR